jgi:hypothetical protein
VKYNKNDLAKIEADAIAGYASEKVVMGVRVLAIRPTENNVVGITAGFRSQPGDAK